MLQQLVLDCSGDPVELQFVSLNSLCLVGVPLCHACPLQLTVILLQILSCSDVFIYIHVYPKQMEN